MKSSPKANSVLSSEHAAKNKLSSMLEQNSATLHFDLLIAA
jgi:hypothetical protein